LNVRKARRKPILTIERIEPIDVIGLEEAKIIDKGKKKRGRPKGSKNETNN
ncbi:MAG: hypothetical protein IMZ53_09910, partial [Thermoplasmata archaeon]|nr:hypothetical protein [Thermoplasmata archaeon]